MTDKIRDSAENHADNKIGNNISDYADNNELSSAKSRALRILGSRALSASEVKKRLINKGVAEQIAYEVVSWLEENGAINDAEFAAQIVGYYSAKGYGIARISDELYRRGIPRDLWDGVLETLEADEVDDAIQRYLEKKLRGSVEKDDLRRATDALIRRGFNYEDAGIAIKKYVETVTEENTE